MSDTSIKLSSKGAFSYQWNKCINNNDFCFIRCIRSVAGFFQGLFGECVVSEAEIASVLIGGKHNDSILAKECDKKLQCRKAEIVNDQEMKGVSVESLTVDKLEKLMKCGNFDSYDDRFSERKLKLLEAGDALRLFNSALGQSDWECRNIAHRLLSVSKCDQKFSILSGIEKANALSFFAECGLSDRLETLLSYGNEEINDRDNYGCCTPLIAAVNAGKVDCVKLLLNKGASASQSNNRSWTPLHYAIRGRHEESLNLLLDRGANVSALNNKGMTPLFYAVDSGMISLPSLKALLLNAKGSMLNVRDHDSNTLLHSAIIHCNVEILEELLKDGAICAQINEVNNYGYTALHLAILHDRIESINTLLDIKDIDVSKRDNKGYTPLDLLLFLYGDKYDQCKVALERKAALQVQEKK